MLMWCDDDEKNDAAQPVNTGLPWVVIDPIYFSASPIYTKHIHTTKKNHHHRVVVDGDGGGGRSKERERDVIRIVMIMHAY